jgi:hypothetical protein
MDSFPLYFQKGEVILKINRNAETIDFEAILEQRPDLK